MTREFLRRHWAWIALIIAAVAYYPRFVHPGGMLIYRHAAECVWTQQILQVCDLSFTYPPAFAFVMLPFVALPMWLAVLVWYLITLSCTALSLVLCKRLALKVIPGIWEGKDLLWFEVLSFLISLKFILAVYEDQAYDLFVLPFTLYGIWALVKRRDLAAGASLAVAAALKVTPLIFLPYLLFKRRFAAAGIFAITLMAVSFLPDIFFTPQGGAHGYFITWVHEVAAPGVFENAAATKYAFWDTANPYNLSLRGMIALGIDQTTSQQHFMVILRSVQIIFIVAIGSLFLMALGWEMIAIEGSLLIIAMLMLSPMSGRGHFVQLMLPYCGAGRRLHPRPADTMARDRRTRSQFCPLHRHSQGHRAPRIYRVHAYAQRHRLGHIGVDRLSGDNCPVPTSVGHRTVANECARDD